MAIFDKSFFFEYEIIRGVGMGRLETTFLEDDKFHVAGTLMFMFLFDSSSVSVFYLVGDRTDSWQQAIKESGGVDRWTFVEGDGMNLRMAVASLGYSDFLVFAKQLDVLIGFVFRDCLTGSKTVAFG